MGESYLPYYRLDIFANMNIDNLFEVADMFYGLQMHQLITKKNLVKNC